MRLLLVSHCPNDPNGGASRVYHFLTDGLGRAGMKFECLHLENIEIPHVMRKLVDRCLMPSFVSRSAERVLEQSTRSIRCRRSRKRHALPALQTP